MTRVRAWCGLSVGLLGVLLVARPHATVIAGVQFSGGIVLAADSSTIDARGLLLDQKVCKLVVGDRHVFGAAGTTISASFNAFHLAAEAVRGAQTVTEVNRRFLARVEPPLRALVHASIRDPEPIWATIASPCRDDARAMCGNLLHYVIAGDEGAALRVSTLALNFRAPASPSVTLDQVKLTTEIEGVDPAIEGAWTPVNLPFALGTYEAIANDVRPVLLPVRDAHEAQIALERLLSKQLAAAPTRTSGPVDMIALTPGRPPVWLAQKPECRS